jgi:hypothetical protein
MSLLKKNHQFLKQSILRLLRRRKDAGGLGSIKRDLVQRELMRSLGTEPVLGNARDAVEIRISTAIRALRVEGKLQPDRKDGRVRLAK